MFLWTVAAAAVILALVSWRRARQATRRVEELSQMYWELKYEQHELRLRIDRLTGVAPGSDDAASSRPSASARATADKPQGFVPLASLKR